MLNYRHLYYFWIVVKEGGFARAAERLDMAVQTISAQVRELEKSVGRQLLKPAGRGVVMTKCAKRVPSALHGSPWVCPMEFQSSPRMRYSRPCSTRHRSGFCATRVNMRNCCRNSRCIGSIWCWHASRRCTTQTCVW
jgi:hypothetical protein